MRNNFNPALALVLAHEGGYVNNPSDPGGPTNKGVTQRVYDAYRQNRMLALQTVRNIGPTEVADIYRNQYWGATGDRLPNGLDYAVFDYSVNSGKSRAIKDLQRCLGQTPDGVCGELTLSAAFEANHDKLINDYCNRRLAFLQSLSTYRVFGKGWSRRVEEVRQAALKIVSLAPVEAAVAPVPPLPAQGKADPADAKIPATALGGAIAGVSAVGAAATQVAHHTHLLALLIGLALLLATVVGFVIWHQGGKEK